MKRLVIATLLLGFLVSCKDKKQEDKPALYPDTIKETEAGNSAQIELGKSLFTGKGQCASCHKSNQKIIGPSIETIAKIYQEQNADMVAFLKGEADPIVDPSQFAVMQANLSITKELSEEQLQALVAYMNSFIQ